MSCEKEQQREARIILQTMLKSPHYIKKLPFGEVALYSGKNSHNIFVKKLMPEIVEFMQLNKWLAYEDGAYNYTKSGAEWVSEFILFVDLCQKQDDLIPLINAAESVNQMMGSKLPPIDGDSSPLLKLFNRQRNLEHKYLSHIHLQAGQKLYEHYKVANLEPQITMNWERLQSTPQTHFMGKESDGFSEQLYIARGKIYESLKYVGQDFAAILVEICLFGRGLEATEKAMKWPARSGKLLLTMALDRLAEYYKIAPQPIDENRYLMWAKQQSNQKMQTG